MGSDTHTHGHCRQIISLVRRLIDCPSLYVCLVIDWHLHDVVWSAPVDGLIGGHYHRT